MYLVEEKKKFDGEKEKKNGEENGLEEEILAAKGAVENKR